MTWQDRWFHAKRRVREFVEDRWFDWTHHVRTSGDVSLRKAGITAGMEADSELYVPARPAHIREALRAAPIPDAQESLARDPRHVVVILLWPRCGDQVARVPGMQLLCATRRHEVFQAYPPVA